MYVSKVQYWPNYCILYRSTVHIVIHGVFLPGALSYRVFFFFTGTPLKVLSVGLPSKSHQKSSKCQNFLTGWHIEFLGGYQ